MDEQRCTFVTSGETVSGALRPRFRGGGSPVTTWELVTAGGSGESNLTGRTV
ncbi:MULTISPECIES: hypothetical protein [Haloferax]|uniref:Uncharacterized protein n=1 Tax=Haloferax marinisediminis TaxID=2666142 RepID=A0A6G1Z275_9EURY|nr:MULTISPECIES: hypothetical protein [Haloferax]MRW80538.1 hypothetical protein [Haloferax marinisediminis]